MNTNCTRLIATLLLTFTLASCGGGGGGSSESTSVETPTTSSPRPETPMTPPPSAQPKVSTYSHGEITLSEYRRRRNELASTYRSHSNFQNQYGLGLVNADAGYANLNLKRGADAANEPGSGIKVGLIDTGIDSISPAFSASSVTEQFLSGAADESPQSWTSLDDYSHGTAVASVIGSRKGSNIWTNSANIQDAHFHGVAWGAQIDMTAIPLGSGSGAYNVISLSSLASSDSGYASLYNNVLGRSIDFLNLSFGVNGSIEAYSTQEIRQNLPQKIAAIAQAGSNQKTIFVWAAGNAWNDTSCNANGRPNACRGNSPNADSPELFAGLVARIRELQGHSIAVVSVNSAGSISNFSNRCGIAANWCIAAPGDRVSIVFYGAAEDQMIPGQIDSSNVRRGVAKVSGTSVAAPFVTGGLALMKHVFRGQLSNTQLVTRLFSTANKQGKYATSSTYGQGLMDLGAATSIVGNPTINVGNSVNSDEFPLTNTSMALGYAFGDSLQRALGGREIMALDELNAPFWFDAGDFVSFSKTDDMSSIVRESVVTDQMRLQWAKPDADQFKFTALSPQLNSSHIENSSSVSQFGLLRFAQGPSASHLGLATGALAASYTQSPNTVITALTSLDTKPDDLPVSGLTIMYTPSVSVPAYFSLGAISERKSILRSTGSGAFGKLGGNSIFGGVGAGINLGSWRVTTEAEVGILNPKISTGIIKKMSPLITTAFSVQSTKKYDSANFLTFGVSQKLRVESGKAKLSAPVARTHEGEVLHSNLTASLSPSGREIELSTRWDHSLSSRKRFSLKGAVVTEPGHNRDANSITRVVAAWVQNF